MHLGAAARLDCPKRQEQGFDHYIQSKKSRGVDSDCYYYYYYTSDLNGGFQGYGSYYATDPYVARIPPNPGLNCSNSTYALDQTFPVDTADHAHEIDDIGLVTIKDSNGNAVNVAWVYFEFNGDEYLQETGNDPSVFDALLKSVPGLGELAQELEATHDDAMVSVASSEGQQLASFLHSNNGFTYGRASRRRRQVDKTWVSHS